MSNESWRPKLHLAPYKGSISDPNGMCQFKGTYNFFCQNAPEYPGNFDSPHGWGHFASRDLVNWTVWDGEPLVKSEQPWEDVYAHKTWFVRHNGRNYHYYCAVNSQNERFIALATSE